MSLTRPGRDTDTRPCWPPAPVEGVVTFERRRWRFGVTWKGGLVCPADIGGAGLGGAAAIGTTPALVPLVVGEKVVGVA
jgi:hypothetical protein